MSLSIHAPRTFSLSQALPYDPKIKMAGSLKTSLKEYKICLLLFKDAVKAFNKKDFLKFDPLVGENSCQIRALYLLILVHTQSAVINNSEIDINIRLNRSDILIQKNFEKAISLKYLLENEELELYLTRDEYFLMQSYLLTFSKSTIPISGLLASRESSDHDVLTKFGKENKIELSNKFYKNLIRNLRGSLSTSSVEFLRELTKVQPDEFISKMLSKCVIKYNECQCTLFFISNSIVIQQLEARSIPIILNVKFLAENEDYRQLDEASIFFKYINKKYQPVIPNLDDLDKPVFVIGGSSSRKTNNSSSEFQFMKDISRHDLIDLYLSNAAAHRQYPDSSQDGIAELENNKTYKYYKNKAEEWGCSLKNPSLLLVSHVFPATVNTLLPVELENKTKTLVSQYFFQYPDTE